MKCHILALIYVSMSFLIRLLTVNPLLPNMPQMVRLAKNFDFSLRKDHQKISYERRKYESVDEKTLS